MKHSRARHLEQSPKCHRWHHELRVEPVNQKNSRCHARHLETHAGPDNWSTAQDATSGILNCAWSRSTRGIQSATGGILKHTQAQQLEPSSRCHLWHLELRAETINRRSSRCHGRHLETLAGPVIWSRVQDATNGILNSARSRSIGELQDATDGILKHRRETPM